MDGISDCVPMASSKLYENIVIGNFLYGLGFAVRAKKSSGLMAGVVNLLQQSPADTLLGDLLLEFPGVVRLIEFKADTNRSSKEVTRHTKLAAGLTGKPDQQRVSRAIHWYVETAPSESEGVDARIVPYLDAFPKKETKHDRLETFIDRTATEVVEGQPDITKEAAKAYLTWVRMTQGEGEVGSGGLLLLADTNGTLRYAQLLDMLELRLQHRQWLNIHEHRIERELRYQRELDLEHKRTRSHGHSLGR